MENGKTPKAKKPIYKRIWFWIVVVIVVAVIGSTLGGGGKDKNKDSSDSKSTATFKSSSQAKVSSSSSEKAKSGWTQEIYDSITSATTGINGDGSISYSNGTPYADIEAKVGKPDTTSEASVGNQTTVVANWTSISWIKGETQSITVQYDKATGQIISKSKFNS